MYKRGIKFLDKHNIISENLRSNIYFFTEYKNPRRVFYLKSTQPYLQNDLRKK